MIAEDIANIFGAMQFMWPHKEVWTPTCLTPSTREPEKEWNLGIRDIDGVEHFSYPAAISIFVYRAGSPGEKDVCSCADTAAARDSGWHIWLYAHKDEGRISYSRFRQADVKKGAH